jgi:hypothetical protein
MIKEKPYPPATYQPLLHLIPDEIKNNFTPGFHVTPLPVPVPIDPVIVHLVPKRIFLFDVATLAAARTWAETWDGGSDNDDFDLALRYLLKGDTGAGDTVAWHLTSWTCTEESLRAASDVYRWSEWVTPAYAWAKGGFKDYLPEQRQKDFEDKYNRYVDITRRGFEDGSTFVTKWLIFSNYNAAYARNEITWAVATNNAELFQWSMDNRWDVFCLWTNAGFGGSGDWCGAGGVAIEGSEYGPAFLAYYVLPLLVAPSMGRDLLAETNWFVEAAWVTNANTLYGGQYIQGFCWGDDEHSDDTYRFPFSKNAYLGQFMAFIAYRYQGTAVGTMAKEWLARVNPPVPNWLKAVMPVDAPPPVPAPVAPPAPPIAAVPEDTWPKSDDWPVEPAAEPGKEPEPIAAAPAAPPAPPPLVTQDPAALPLDYFAPGSGYCWVRSSWDDNATVVLLQLRRGESSHCHLDAGCFQIWRNGAFVTRETTSYQVQYNDARSGDTCMHNCLTVAGMNDGRGDGQSRIPNGRGTVLRVQSHADFFYAAVDLTDCSRSTSVLDNPELISHVREFLFLRNLETLVVRDRVQTVHRDMAKTFRVHSQWPWEDLLGTGGTLAVTVVLPAAVQMNYLYEGEGMSPPTGQHRLSILSQDQEDTTFLTVLQARDAGAPDLAVSMNATILQINAEMIDFDTMLCNGVPLRQDVQPFAADQDGCRWITG